MNDNEVAWIRKFIGENPALLLSGIYAVASMIGLVYSWTFLRGFGINVFHFAEISDFLLASLKEPFTWLIAIGAVLLAWSDNISSRSVQRRNPGKWLRWYGSQTYRNTNYLVSVVMVMIFLYIYADHQQKKVRDGDGVFVTVHLADGSAPKTLTMLGTTGKFLLLYDHQRERVDIHPHENVLTITRSAGGS